MCCLETAWDSVAWRRLGTLLPGDLAAGERPKGGERGLGTDQTQQSQGHGWTPEGEGHRR